jgi:DNA-binding GntR family transcriptional regulator
MPKPPPIIATSLREQVYAHLRAQLKRGALDTGAFLDLNQLAKDLGVSRTPLRDALIRFEVEEFVTIAPRRGVAVRTLEPGDIRELYQLVGALEATAVLAAGPGLTAADLDQLRALDQAALDCVERDDLEGYYRHNYGFHDFFLERLGNGRITALVHLKKQQLYDWNRRLEHLHAPWEHSGIHEHDEIIRLLAEGAVAEAAAYLRDVHWGFNVQEPFVKQVYFPEAP